MQYELDGDAQGRLEAYFAGIGGLLGHKKRREAFAGYALGLSSELERKSVEPIAAMICPDPDRVDAIHQRLLHFVGQAEWVDGVVRRHAAEYALEPLTAKESIEAWVLDDTRGEPSYAA